MARSLKKGPYVEAKLEKKVIAMTEGKTKKSSNQDLESQKHDYS